MSIALSNFLLDFKQRGLLQEFNEVNSLLTQNHQTNDSIFQQFSESNIIKNEFLKAIILSQLSNTFQAPLPPSQSSSIPKTPIQSSIYPSIIPENLLLTETPKKPQKNSSKPAENSSNAQTSPMPSSEVFKIIYQQSFEKYTKIILTASTKADKTKSFRAQIKNIVEGIIVSNQKKSGFVVDFSADKVTESIIVDLENHEIVNVGISNVKYNEEIIRQFFGDSKTKVFVPGFYIGNGYSEIGGKEVSSKESEERVLEDNWEMKFLEFCVRDESLYDAKTVGELSYNIHLALIKYLNSVKFDGICGNIMQVVDTVLKEMISRYFVSKDMEVAEVLNDVHQHFSISLIRNQVYN